MVHVGGDESDRESRPQAGPLEAESGDHAQGAESGAAGKAARNATHGEPVAPDTSSQTEASQVTPDTKGKTDQNQQGAEKRFWTDLNVREWISAIATTVAAAAAIAAVGVAYCSYQASSDQLGVMQRQLRDAETAASDAATDARSAAAREDALISANQSLASAAGRQAGASQSLAGTASSQLAQQKSQFEIDQAPTLEIGGDGIPPTAPFGPTYADGTVGWNYGVKNVGKGRAANIKATRYIAILAHPFVNAGSAQMPNELVGGEGMWSTIRYTSALPKADFDKLVATDEGIIVAIDMTYSDASGHRTTEVKYCADHFANGSVVICDYGDFMRQSAKLAAGKKP